jgi:hypothetical protein
MNNKMQPKDLITVGIFSAIYFVIYMGVAMLGYVPIFIPLLSVLCPLIAGIPFMLYFTKQSWRFPLLVRFQGFFVLSNPLLPASFPPFSYLSPVLG